MTNDGARQNTDRELWRERPDDYYAHSIHVTVGGGIGINCGGRVIVLPLWRWHELAMNEFGNDLFKGPALYDAYRQDSELLDRLQDEYPTIRRGAASLTTIRGDLNQLIETWRARADRRGGDDREFYTGVGERLCANDLTAALAVSRVPTDG